MVEYSCKTLCRRGHTTPYHVLGFASLSLKGSQKEFDPSWICFMGDWCLKNWSILFKKDDVLLVEVVSGSWWKIYIE